MSSEESRSGLEDRPFSYRVTRDGKVFVSWRGRTVTTLAGDRARTFLRKVEGVDSEQQQRAMARVTGNFKRGNER